MPLRFNALFFALAIVAIGTCAASCGSGNSAARLRVVQTIAGAPSNLDISLGGKSAFTDVGFGVVLPQSGYNSLSPGNDTIAVFQTGTATPVIQSTPLNLRGKSEYTVVLTGPYAAPTALLVGDNNTSPPSGQVELRVIDASPSAPPALDIYMVAPGTDITEAVPSISSLSFEQASLYIPLTTHDGVTGSMVVVTPAGDSTQQLINHTYTLIDGQIRTLVLVDVPSGGSLSFTPLELADF